jgi:thioredoxin reductase
LNAALILGRCRRNVLMIDSGKPRNRASRALHGFLTRDGTPPLELRELGRQQLVQYPNVRLLENREALDARRVDEGFRLVLDDGVQIRTRSLLLATGRIDLVPAKPGFAKYYGAGVYHCPYCDGWEQRDQPLIAYGQGERAYDMALALRCWSQEITLCSDGPSGLSAGQRARLKANGIPVVEEPITEARGNENGFLTEVVFERRAPIGCRALFFCSDCLQKSPLGENLGCDLDDEGSVMCDGHAATRVPGLFVAGNVRGGVHLAIVAAAEGAEAAMAINEWLHDRELG